MKNIFTYITIAVVFTALGYFISQQVGTESSSWSSQSPKKVERAISSVDADEQKMIDEITDSILAIKNKEQLKESLVALKGKAEANKDKKLVQIYYYALKPLEVMEGLVWRLRGVVESCQVCHISALNFIRSLFYKDYMYGPHVKAILEYLVEPPAEPNGKLFTSVSDLQENYIRPVLIDNLEKTIKGLETTVGQLDDNFSFRFDNRLLTGYDASTGKRFISEAKVDKIVVKGNFYYMLARRERFLGFLYFFINYNFDSVNKYINSVIVRTKVNTILGDILSIGEKPGVVNNTTMDFVEVLKKYPSIGRVFGNKCTAWHDKNLRRSFELYRNVQIHRLAGLKMSLAQSDMNNSEAYLLRPKVLASNEEDFENALEERVKIWNTAFVEGRSVEITNLVAAGQLRVNPGAFFKCYSNLQQFVPFTAKEGGTDHVTDGNYIDKAKKVWRWDYLRGRPVKFKDPKFGGLLPDATNENFYEIYRSFRTNPATRRMATVLPFL